MAGGYGDVQLAERSKIYYIAGTWDPTVQATLAPEGSMYLRVGPGGGALYQKLDDGTTTNWVLNQTSGGGGGAIPVTQNIYVEPNGSDVTGDGSRSTPFQSINAAIAVCTNPAIIYTIVPGSGDYSGPDVTWLPNVCMIGSGAAQINNNINYTSPAASESYFFFENVRMGGLITIDLSLAAIAIHTFTTGSYNINRIDTMGVGPWVLLVSDSTLGDSSFGGNNILSNALFVSSLEIKDGGTVLLGNSPVGIPVDLYGTATISFQASNTQGAVITGNTVGPNTPTIITDSAGLIGATYTNCNVFYGNVQGSAINGSVVDLGVLIASANGSSVSGKAEGLNSELNSSQLGSEARGYALSGGKILSSAGGSSASGEANGVNSKIYASGSGASSRGSASADSEINSSGTGAQAFGYSSFGATLPGQINASGEGSNSSGECVGGNIAATSGGASARGAIYNDSSVLAKILAQETGASSSGFIETSGVNNTSDNTISSSGSGSSVNGMINTSSDNNSSINIIDALASGGIVAGRIAVTGLGNASQNTISGTGAGTLAIGRIRSSGAGSTGTNQILSNVGSQTIGYIDNNGTTANGEISSNLGWAFGIVQPTGIRDATIRQSGLGGAFVFGKASSTAAGTASILSSGRGSFAGGNCQRQSISASGDGAFAMGHVDGSASVGGVNSSGVASFAFGYAGGIGSISASGTCSFAFGSEIAVSFNFASAIGQGHTTNLDGQFLCGQYSSTTLNPKFAVGAGSFGSPANCFEVDALGRYKTYGTQTRKVNVVSVFDYTINSATPDDVVIAITSAPGQKVFLPAAPVNGDEYSIKCDSASTDTLDVDGNGNNIDTAAIYSVIIGSSITVVFANGKWQVIGIV